MSETEAKRKPGRPRKNPEPAPEVAPEAVREPAERKTNLPVTLLWKGRKPVYAYETRDGKSYGVKIFPGDFVACHQKKTVDTLKKLGAVVESGEPEGVVPWSVFTD